MSRETRTAIGTASSITSMSAAPCTDAMPHTPHSRTIRGSIGKKQMPCRASPSSSDGQRPPDAGAEHIHDDAEAVERHGKALDAQREHADAHKLGIVLRKKQQDGAGEDPDNERHSGNAGDACDHGKPERFPHAVKPLRAPREARHG